MYLSEYFTLDPNSIAKPRIDSSTNIGGLENDFIYKGIKYINYMDDYFKQDYLFNEFL